MDIFDPIAQSKSLIKQLSAVITDNRQPEIASLLDALTRHLDQIKANTSSLQQQVVLLSKNPTHLKKHSPIVINTPGVKSGCYIFSGEKGFFCPRCYDEYGNKVATTRLNSKLRICPACRTSIK